MRGTSVSLLIQTATHKTNMSFFLEGFLEVETVDGPREIYDVDSALTAYIWKPAAHLSSRTLGRTIQAGSRSPPKEAVAGPEASHV